MTFEFTQEDVKRCAPAEELNVQHADPDFSFDGLFFNSVYFKQAREQEQAFERIKKDYTARIRQSVSTALAMCHVHPGDVIRTGRFNGIPTAEYEVDALVVSTTGGVEARLVRLNLKSGLRTGVVEHCGIRSIKPEQIVRRGTK